MKNCYTFPALFLTAVVILKAETATVELRPAAGSRMELIVEKTGLMSGRKHLFTFAQYQGTLRFDRDSPESSAVEFSIEAASIVCQDTWVSAKDLRKVQQHALNDMLSAAKYPRIRFRSTGVRRKEANLYDVEGVLTIREVARPVVVSASLTAGQGSSIVLDGTARIRLTNFWLKPPTAALGTIGTKDEITLHFTLPATPAPADR